MVHVGANAGVQTLRVVLWSWNRCPHGRLSDGTAQLAAVEAARIRAEAEPRRTLQGPRVELLSPGCQRSLIAASHSKLSSPPDTSP